MSKVCRFNARIRCWHFRCDYVDSMGNVRVCCHHPNPSGLCMPKRVRVVLECSK